MKTLMAVLAMVVGGAAWAACPEGWVSASCNDGSLNCCMPVGRIDCGNGKNNISEDMCELSRQETRRWTPQPPQTQQPVPPGASEGGIGSGHRQPCKSGQTFNYQGECADGMR